MPGHSCEVFGKSLNLSEPLLSHLRNGILFKDEAFTIKLVIWETVKLGKGVE